MNVHPMMRKVLRIPYPMVRKSPFPNLDRISQSFFYSMRKAAFDELQRAFQRDLRWSQQ